MRGGGGRGRGGTRVSVFVWGIRQDNKEIRQHLLDMGAPSLGVELMPVDVHFERTIKAFASRSNGGLVVTSSTLAIVHRELIIALAVHHRLPTA